MAYAGATILRPGLLFIGSATCFRPQPRRNTGWSTTSRLSLLCSSSWWGRGAGCGGHAGQAHPTSCCAQPACPTAARLFEIRVRGAEWAQHVTAALHALLPASNCLHSSSRADACTTCNCGRWWSTCRPHFGRASWLCAGPGLHVQPWEACICPCCPGASGRVLVVHGPAHAVPTAADPAGSAAAAVPTAVPTAHYTLAGMGRFGPHSRQHSASAACRCGLAIPCASVSWLPAAACCSATLPAPVPAAATAALAGAQPARHSFCCCHRGCNSCRGGCGTGCLGAAACTLQVGACEAKGGCVHMGRVLCCRFMQAHYGHAEATTVCCSLPNLNCMGCCAILHIPPAHKQPLQEWPVLRSLCAGL